MVGLASGQVASPGAAVRDRGMAARSPEAAMTSTTLLPFQLDAMTPAQLAAVSYLARLTDTRTPCTPISRAAGLPGARPVTWTP